MLIKLFSKSRKWLSEILILAIITQVALFALSIPTSAAPGDTYFKNLTVTPSDFDPNEEGAKINYDLLLDANIDATVVNSRSETKAFLAIEEPTSAGNISYKWYGREGNSPTGAVLPEDIYTVRLAAYDDKGNILDDASETVIISLPGPSQSNYQINMTNVSEPRIDNDYDVKIDFSNKEPAGTYGYDNALIKLTVNSAAGDFDLIVKSADDGSLYDLEEDGYWGETGGFVLNAKHSESVPGTISFEKTGFYSLTIELIEANRDETVIASTNETFRVTDDGQSSTVPPSLDPGDGDIGDDDPRDGSSGGGTLFPDDEEGSVELESSDDIADPFIDTEDHWAEEFIEELRLNGIVSGKSDGIFEPDSPLTRAEAVKIVIGLNEIPLLSETVEVKPFPDVEIDEWYSPYLETGKAEEIVSGYGDGLFRPNQVVTRAEALRILLEASLEGEISGDEEALTYPDMEEYAWYLEYVAFATEVALVEGYSDGTFRPYQAITRAEFAKLSAMMLE